MTFIVHFLWLFTSNIKKRIQIPMSMLLTEFRFSFSKRDSLHSSTTTCGSCAEEDSSFLIFQEEETQLQLELLITQLEQLPCLSSPQDSDQWCSVCLTSTQLDACLASCGHFYHRDCLTKWLRSTLTFACPLCQTPIQQIIPPSQLTKQSSCILINQHITPFPLQQVEPTCSFPQQQEEEEEWGWFTELEEEPTHVHLVEEKPQRHSHTSGSTLVTNPPPLTRRNSLEAGFKYIEEKKLSDRRHETVCKSFPPASFNYQDAGFEWLRQLDPLSHISCACNVSKFRIVESKQQTKHAEYLIQFTIDGRIVLNSWKRHSQIQQFMNKFASRQQQFSPKSWQIWETISTKSRWFNTLDKEYLYRKCIAIERFVHVLMSEAQSPVAIAEFMGIQQ